MGNRKLYLKISVIIGITLAVILSMAAILVHERYRMRRIEGEAARIQEVRLGIGALATLGESVIGWTEADYLHYRARRLLTDSLLQALKPHCRDFVRPSQIDTLRLLLENKEAHLLRIMEAFELQNRADSLLANQLPEVAERATRVRTVKRKKDNFWGKLGAKETVRVLPSAKELHAFSDSLIAMQQAQTAEMDAYADSLRMLGRRLNTQLDRLVGDLDTQAQEALAQKERKAAEAERLSFRLIAGVAGVTIVLLAFSHLVIIRDLRRRERGRKRLEDALEQNRTLSDVRKKIIVTLSHDIRGPLNAISGSAELAMDTRDRKRRNAYLGNILDSSRHIARLANSLLDLSRLDEAKETLNAVPFCWKGWRKNTPVRPMTRACCSSRKSTARASPSSATRIVSNRCWATCLTTP